jgi:hypothetical protein
MESLSSTSIMSGNHSSTPSVERSETIASEDCLSQLPEETIQRIFGYLSRRELGLNSQVSRRWYRLSSDPYLLNAALTITFPSLSIIDASRWAKCFGDLSRYGVSVEDEPPIDNSTSIPILKQFSSLPIEKKLRETNEEGERIKEDAGFTLLTIPKGLTFNKLVNMAEEGDKFKFKCIWAEISKEIGNIEVDKTYRILITNNILEGSGGLFLEEQKAFVKKTFKCEMPNVLAALALIVTTFIDSGKRLYSDNCICCTDRVMEEFSVAIDLGSHGPNVHFVYGDSSCFSGVAALRKL